MWRSAWRDKNSAAILIIVALLVLGATARKAPAYDLSADTSMTEDGRTQLGKIYIKGDKYRIQRNGENEYIIIRHDKDAMWVVMPKEKVYIPLPLNAAKTPKIQETSPGEVSRRFLGASEVDGHSADKYEITVREGPRKETFYQWTATDINFPIKTTAIDGAWTVEFTNIKQGVSDSLFEIPADYQKVRPKPDSESEGPTGKEGSSYLIPMSFSMAAWAFL